MLAEINRTIPDFLLKPHYRFYRHLAVQTVVLLITVNILWDEPDSIIPERLAGWFTYFLQINTVIYVNMYLLVPRLLVRGKILHYMLLLLLLVLGSIVALGLLRNALTADGDSPENPLLFLESVSSLVAFIVFITGLTAIHMFRYRLENMQKISDLESSTMAIELAGLQSQINPHFLFNMLNSANILTGEDAEKSSRILKRLNSLLRYQTDGESRGTVNLGDDIAFLNDCLDLEKTRRDRFDYVIHQEGDSNINVPPLLFIPFVENAIKHNPESGSHVRIVFRITGDRLYFECENPKARLPRANATGGTGLINIKKRLELLFGKEYSLNLRDEKERYLVTLNFKI
jgi:sensor histidine kinase YesM